MVTPTLHKWYTRHEALAAFEGELRSESFCDGQFVVGPTTVLCFATIGNESAESHLPCPSSLVWRPTRLNYAPSEDIPWLPAKVREVWDRRQSPTKKLREHHVFIRLPADEQFLYAGSAHLGSYTAAVLRGDRSEISATFSLSARLPRDAWLTFGGYAGWLVDVNHKSYRVAADDLPMLERLLIAELPQLEFSHLCMTRYEEDSLTVHTNADRGWLMYLPCPEDSGLYIRSVEDIDNPMPDDLFQCSCGIELKLPRTQTLPRELAVRLAVEFFCHGELPKSVQWGPA